MYVEEGHELSITCPNRMETSSSVLWTRNGIPVQTGKSKFLSIKIINRTDAGNYICVSLSPDGNHSSPMTTVDVLCKLVLYYDLVWTEQLVKNLLRMFIFSNMFLVFLNSIDSKALKTALYVLSREPRQSVLEFSQTKLNAN